MKYFAIKNINVAISYIKEGNDTKEHVTSRAVSALLANYFPVNKYICTPKQTQELTNKKPDYSIEKFNDKANLLSSYKPHCFVEVKSLVNSNIPDAIEQLYNTVFVAVDSLGLNTGTFSVFMIGGVKGTKIAFLVYHSISSLLEEYGIPNYKGFIPLNYKIPEDKLMDLNDNCPLKEQIYSRYTRGMDFETDYDKLKELGVIYTKKIRHPYIFDFLNKDHKEYIHCMFKYITDNTPDFTSSI